VSVESVDVSRERYRRCGHNPRPFRSESIGHPFVRDRETEAADARGAMQARSICSCLTRGVYEEWAMGIIYVVAANRAAWLCSIVACPLSHRRMRRRFSRRDYRRARPRLAGGRMVAFMGLRREQGFSLGPVLPRLAATNPVGSRASTPLRSCAIVIQELPRLPRRGRMCQAFTLAMSASSRNAAMGKERSGGQWSMAGKKSDWPVWERLAYEP